MRLAREVQIVGAAGTICSRSAGSQSTRVPHTLTRLVVALPGSDIDTSMNRPACVVIDIGVSVWRQTSRAQSISAGDIE